MDAPRPFDPRRQRLARDRAARKAVSGADFLFTRVAADLAERLSAVNRRFDLALDLGGRDGLIAHAFAADPAAAAHVGQVITADPSPAFAERAPGPALAAQPDSLPFADASLDLVVAPLSLHWVNDLPGALIQIRRALRPDGLFLGTLFGGRTLTELRQCLVEAEAELTGGAGARIAPFADAADMGRLLQRAGFALPVADSDVITVRYGDPFRLLRDLQAMGETAVGLAGPRPPLPRAAIARAMALYAVRFADPDGRVRATFEVITATGWAPHDSQQKPLRPGSARSRLADALGVEEKSAGEKPHE
jgi:SAM-dependent methyltransferase